MNYSVTHCYACGYPVADTLWITSDIQNKRAAAAGIGRTMEDWTSYGRSLIVPIRQCSRSVSLNRPASSNPNQVAAHSTSEGTVCGVSQ